MPATAAACSRRRVGGGGGVRPPARAQLAEGTPMVPARVLKPCSRGTGSGTAVSRHACPRGSERTPLRSSLAPLHALPDLRPPYPSPCTPDWAVGVREAWRVVLPRAMGRSHGSDSEEFGTDGMRRSCWTPEVRRGEWVGATDPPPTSLQRGGGRPAGLQACSRPLAGPLVRARGALGLASAHAAQPHLGSLPAAGAARHLAARQTAADG